jgi:hypothetical protein
MERAMRCWLLLLVLVTFGVPAFGQSASWVAVNEDGDGFVVSSQRAPFIPWGFNYSRDDRFRLLEDYWTRDEPDGWPKVERDFREMKRLGANIVRVNLQFARFMDAPGAPNQTNLARLEKLIDLADDVGVYLLMTGLGTFREADVPSWYRNLAEKERWAAQATFWEAVAKVCANRPRVFAYNLMNEPLVSTARRPPGAWTHPSEMEGLRYLEYINLEPDGRRPSDIARAWLRQMTQAIRRHDQRHLVTVGLIWIDNAKPEELAGFPPADIASEVDFLAVHVYPAAGGVDVALSSLARYRKGKPVVIEETFPLNCTPDEYADFLRRSRGIAAGWLAHFWSLTPEDLKGRTDAASGLMLESLNVFEALNPNR